MTDPAEKVTGIKNIQESHRNTKSIEQRDYGTEKPIQVEDECLLTADDEQLLWGKVY